MNKLVEIKFNMKDGGRMKLYRRNENQTGVYMKVNDQIIQRTYPLDIDSFINVDMKGELELTETVRQIKERVLGNADIAYEISTFNKGKFVKSEVKAPNLRI